jgi:hypothetical protein
MEFKFPVELKQKCSIFLSESHYFLIRVSPLAATLGAGQYQLVECGTF